MSDGLTSGSKQSDGLTSGRKSDGLTLGSKPKKSAEMKKHFDRILNLAEEKAGEPSASRPGRGKLRVGSDCAGMGSDLAALTLFGFREQIETSMWSDSDPDKRKLYRHVCSLLDLDVSPVCKDMSKRNAATAPSCDVYVAGYPCPSYSVLGKKKGVQDPRGQIGLYGLEYICHHKPSCVVLENVKGLLQKKHQQFRQLIKDVLEKLGYTLRLKLHSTLDYGIPQSRQRVYIVALLKDAIVTRFHWPKKVEFKKKWLKEFLDTHLRGEPGQRCNIENYVRKYGDRVRQGPYVLDVGSSEAFQSAKKYVVPCLTRSRLKGKQTGFFVPKLDRRLTVREAGRLQGWPEQMLNSLLKSFDESTVGASLRDAMSINVLGKNLLECMVSLGHVSREEAAARDHWVNSATTRSAADRAWQLFRPRK